MKKLDDTFGLEALCFELTRDEGEVLHVYQDPGSGEAIGVGRNLTTQGISSEELAILGTTMEIIREIGLTHEQAVVLLHNDIADRAHQLDAYCPWWRLLSPCRQRVLLNMAFEMGTHGMMIKQALAVEAIQRGKFQQAATAMLSSMWGLGKTHNRAARLAQQLVTDKPV